MLGKWKFSNSSAKTTEAMPPVAAEHRVLPNQHGHDTRERKCARSGYYFCLIQSSPFPSCYIFRDIGDYVVGCSCANNTFGTLVPIPLGRFLECRGKCPQLRVKVRETSIALHQPSWLPASSTEVDQIFTCHFLKETGKGLELFTQIDSAENCSFRMLPVKMSDRRTINKSDGPICSFSLRRVLLGMDRQLSRCASKGAVHSRMGTRCAAATNLTEYDVPISCRFEIFLDVRLGKGGNGEVFLGIERMQGQAVAIKREPKEMLRHEFSLIREIRLDGPLLTYRAQDPHPTKFLGLVVHSVAVEVGNSAVATAIAHHSAVDDTHDHLALELVNGGELRKFLKTKHTSGMPVEVARVYIYQIVCALVLIHSKNIIHRDLKTQNILVRHGETFLADEVKLIDFGNSAKVKPGSIFTKNYTTCFACAPEQFLLTGKGYSYAIDVWAVGTIFFELLTGERLFECLNIHEASRQIPAFKEKQVKDRLPCIRQDAKDFLLKCLTKDPRKRPTALQLLTSPFLFPLHIYQIRRRIETTDVYTSYMKAFEKGWGNLQPIQDVSMTESIYYDGAAAMFTSDFTDSDAVNVVLPVFECVPDFRSQDRGIQIHHWALESDASFYFIKAEAGEPGASRFSTSSTSLPKNDSVQSFTSNGSSQDFGDICLSPGLNKSLSECQIFHSANSAPKFGQGIPQCSLTCSTASLASPMPPPSLVYGGAADPLAGSQGTIEALAERIDSL
ncbi:uncharacterized protein LOC34620003 [Cyclospora cayetanensis]|uniref:Uncharacterized protein LOC34620003 n=1 Tax=Cyclospora cayetanensis TaxID=88456 RepID=A0A6P6RVC2_9EIME|nr:uncharacterized protein LOC34620003 [Cyclospora cayetanensis]